MNTTKKKLDPFTYDVYGADAGSGGGSAPAATPAAAIQRPQPLSAAQRAGQNARNTLTNVALGTLRLNPLAPATSVAATATPAVVSGIKDAAYGFTNPAAGRRPTPAPTAPTVRNPAAPAVGGGGSTPAGGVPSTKVAPAPAPAAAAAIKRPGAVSNTGAQPIPYTTSDGRTGALPPGVAVVRQADGTNAFGATGASVAAAIGNPRPAAPAPAVAAAAPIVAPPNVGIGAPATASVSRDAEAQRQAAVSEIGSQLFQLRGQNTRSARGAIADLLQVQAGLANEGGRQAADISAGNRDAAVRQTIAGAEQMGQNQRAALQENGATQRTVLTVNGDAARAARPELVTDADGNYLAVDPTTGAARGVTDPTGAQVRMPVAPKNTGRLTADKVVEAYTDQLAAAPLGVDPTAWRAQLDASPLGQAYAAALGSNSAGGGAPSAGKPPANEDEFVQRARAAGRTESDEELRAFYRRRSQGQ